MSTNRIGNISVFVKKNIITYIQKFLDGKALGCLHTVWHSRQGVKHQYP